MSVETKLLTPNEVCRVLSHEAIRDLKVNKYANALIRIVGGKMLDAVIVIADSDEECTTRMKEILKASGEGILHE